MINEYAYVYIMANKRNGTLYLGSAANLVRRVWEHRNDVVPGFTRRHRCHILVWYEGHGDLESARLRERRKKEWRRAWKLRRIEEFNPDWVDLYERIALP